MSVEVSGCLSEIWVGLRNWSSVIGLGFDIVGACLVYVGVRTSLVEALRLEESVVPMTIDDIGGDEMLKKAEASSKRRAEERLRAKRWAFIGLVFFLLGFALQAIGSWPKSA